MYNADMVKPCGLPHNERLVRVAEVLSRLESAYGRPEWMVARPPLDELVVTILSQHTSDANCERAFQALRVAFPTWQEVADAPVQSIADAIRCGGLGSMKAPRIKAVVAEALVSQLPDLLQTMPLDVAKERLQQLPGVGPKTAACVLLFACGKPALPVDTHVFRVARRLGLIDEPLSAERAHNELEELLESDDVYSFHVNVIRHGRGVCRARSPRCEICTLASICNFAVRQDTMVSANDND